MRRRTYSIVAATATAVVLAGCGSSHNQDPVAAAVSKVPGVHQTEDSLVGGGKQIITRESSGNYQLWTVDAKGASSHVDIPGSVGAGPFYPGQGPSGTPYLLTRRALWRLRAGAAQLIFEVIDPAQGNGLRSDMTEPEFRAAIADAFAPVPASANASMEAEYRDLADTFASGHPDVPVSVAWPDGTRTYTGDPKTYEPDPASTFVGGDGHVARWNSMTPTQFSAHQKWLTDPAVVAYTVTRQGLPTVLGI